MKVVRAWADGCNLGNVHLSTEPLHRSSDKAAGGVEFPPRPPAFYLNHFWGFKHHGIVGEAFFPCCNVDARRSNGIETESYLSALLAAMAHRLPCGIQLGEGNLLLAMLRITYLSLVPENSAGLANAHAAIPWRTELSSSVRLESVRAIWGGREGLASAQPKGPEC